MWPLICTFLLYLSLFLVSSGGLLANLNMHRILRNSISFSVRVQVGIMECEHAQSRARRR